MIEVDGATVGEVLDAVAAECPALAPILAAGVSVAVDGQVMTGARREPVKPDSEIFIFQKMKGG